MKHQHLWMTVLTLVSSLLLSVFIASPVKAESDLAVMPVLEKSFPKVEEFVAVVEATYHSTVSSRIAAEVIELNYDVDDVVPKGAVIMRFRDEEFQSRVAQIEAGLLADKAQNREALARQKEAASEAERVQQLFNKKLLAKAALDKANADLKAAKARAQATQAQLKARQAQLEESKVQLSYTQILAPYSGVVTERLIELGEMASPGQHLMTGVSLEHLRAVANVPQYLFSTVKLAQDPVLILADGRQINGEKITSIPYADTKSHSFQFRVDLATGIEHVYPGMFGKLQFHVGDEQIQVIPQSAIVQRSEVAGVYVLMDDNRLLFRQIRLGRLMVGEQREILAGLEEGEQVALDPLQASRLLKQSQQEHRHEQ